MTRPVSWNDISGFEYCSDGSGCWGDCNIKNSGWTGFHWGLTMVISYFTTFVSLVGTQGYTGMMVKGAYGTIF
jgi:hypothetical protein